MTAARKHPLTVGQWARRMDDCDPDEAMVKLIAVDGMTWTVRAHGGREVKLLAGYLEAVSGAYAP